MLKYNPVLYICLVFTLYACATMPTVETNNQRLALIELSYGELIDKVALYRSENRLTDEKYSEIRKTLGNIDTALDLAYTAIITKDQGTFDTSTQAINSGLTLIRNYLVEADQ